MRDDPRVLVGYETSDDAAAVRFDGGSEGRILLQSVDFITPIVDDPITFGQIAAANALSDIYAMGGQPIFALNIVGFPRDELPLDTLSDILAGGIEKAHEANIHVLGGHTIDDREPKYGMVVTGEVEESRMILNSTAKPGDLLVLTKALGTGIIATAIKRGQAPEDAVAAATTSMITLNRSAAEAAQEVGVHAMTDVTGYGLLGHLMELSKASGLAATINYGALPFMPQVAQLAAEGIIPGGTKRNLKHVRDALENVGDLSETQLLMAADAQTSGGMLIAVATGKAEALIAALEARQSPMAVIIGRLDSGEAGRMTLTAD